MPFLAQSPSEEERVRQVIIECAGLTGGKELWQRYIDAARPEYGHIFGRNLDAFWDAVSGGGPGWPGENVELVFRNSGQLAQIVAGNGMTYLQCFERFARDQSATRITLA
jgi:RNAse (barnase) inhibitor barstar